MKKEAADFENAKTNVKAKKNCDFYAFEALGQCCVRSAGMTPHTRAWENIDEVFIPCHVNDDNWLLAYVHLVRRIIAIYDSHFLRSMWAKVKKQLAHLSFVIPSLLKVTGFDKA